MKASDIDLARELLDDHAGAIRTLEAFWAIPEAADRINIVFRWSNPDPDAPAHSRHLSFGTAIPTDSNEGRTIKEDIESRLVAERDRIEGELRKLGVEPDA